MATSMLTDPHRRHRRLLGANHSRIDQVQITHHCCLPPGHDWTDWHGASPSYPRLWNQRFAEGRRGNGLTFMMTQYKKPNGTNVTEPSPHTGQFLPWPSPTATITPTINLSKTRDTGLSLPKHPTSMAHSRQACNARPHRGCQGRLTSLGAR